MKVFVSGSTGFIGSRLVRELSDRGITVHALYRSESKAKSIQHKNVRLFKGDILDYQSVVNAVKGCSQAYHVAAYASIWTRDSSTIYRLNIEGALHVIHAAMAEGVKKMVITSTAGVFGPSQNGPVNESNQPESFFIDYEYSKFLLEKAIEIISLSGTELVIVNPTRVFGPGLISESNSVTKMIDSYRKGKWRLIPGKGKSVGNYVFVDDVVSGHIQAMEKGRSGEKYILGGEDVSYNEFFVTLKNLTGRRQIMFKVPAFWILNISRIMIFLAKNFGIKPFITPGLARKFYHDFRVSSEKATKELGYNFTGFEEAVKLTLKWMEIKEENIQNN